MMTSKKQIFVCDDDISILGVLKIILEITGADVHTEPHSNKLIARLEESCPDLLIIDLWMPKIGGEEIIRYLKSNKKFNRLYILCISASIEGKQIALQAGADAFLSKPFDIDDILNIANQIIYPSAL